MPRRPRRPRVLAPVRPNAGLEAGYRQRLDRMLEEMEASLIYWLQAAWRANPPKLAQDALPATDLRREMRTLARRWQSRFDDAAPKLASYFATAAKDRVDGALQKILRDGGFSVQFRLTPSLQDAYQAVIGENVGLIKSIPEQHLSQVEGLVMRSVSEGRDLGTLTKRLEDQFGLTRNRAALIARDQNNKANSVITRARQLEVGIEEADWLHSGAGKHPRPSHVAFGAGKLGGPRYQVAKGAYIDGEWIFPGQLINCRCVGRSVIPGLD